MFKPRPKRVNFTDSKAIKQVRSHVQSFLSRPKELKDSKTELPLQVKMSRESLRGMLGTRAYPFVTGGRSSIQTTAANIMNFGVNTSASVQLDSTCVTEITALITLFDEVKVTGVTWVYNPVNPFNRGAVTVSIPVAFYFDDDDYTNAPTNSVANMASLANRRPRYVSFSPDHTNSGHFSRSSPQSEYDWGDTSSLGNTIATKCCFVIVGDGLNTASVTYGFVDYWFHLSLKARI